MIWQGSDHFVCNIWFIGTIKVVVIVSHTWAELSSVVRRHFKENLPCQSLHQCKITSLLNQWFDRYRQTMRRYRATPLGNWKAVFTCLLCHPARKWIVPIPQLPVLTQGPTTWLLTTRQQYNTPVYMNRRTHCYYLLNRFNQCRTEGASRHLVTQIEILNRDANLEATGPRSQLHIHVNWWTFELHHTVVTLLQYLTFIYHPHSPTC